MYATINGSLIGVTSAWASELIGLGIRSHGVVMGEGPTPLHHRQVTSEEVAETIVFLLSLCTVGIQGEFVYVDVGYVHLDRGVH